MRIKVPTVRLRLRLRLFLLGSGLMSLGACQNDQALQVVATPVVTNEVVDVFSEADVVSSQVRAETSDAYCGLLDGVTFKEKLISAVNQLRATVQTCGEQVMPASSPVAWNVKLQRAAYGHSSQMAISNVISHFSLDSSPPSDRVRAVDYRFAAVGENICAGMFDITGAINAWLGSPTHCRQMLSSEYTEIAVACVKRDKSSYRRHWTMILARPLPKPVPVLAERRRIDDDLTVQR